METKDTKAAPGDESFDFRLDPNRVRTNAEVQLFADVFSISFDEARQILTKAGRKCQSRFQQREENRALISPSVTRWGHGESQ